MPFGSDNAYQSTRRVKNIRTLSASASTPVPSSSALSSECNRNHITPSSSSSAATNSRLLRHPLSTAYDLGVARLLADRLLVMKQGQVVESGLTDRVLDDPHHPYTQLLVSSVLQN